MGFSIKLAPGVRVKASSRGLRASVGPRVARVHVGGGRTGVSSGVGPLSVYGSLAPRRRAGGGRPTVASRERELAQRARAQARQDSIERVRTLTETFSHILELHRTEFEPLRAPEAAVAPQHDREAVLRRHEREAMAGIGIFKRAERTQARARAAESAAAESARLNHDADLDRARLQADLDEGWRRLRSNDPSTVLATLEEAFADNEMPAAAIDVQGAELSLAVLVPDLEDAVPDVWPGISAAGNPTFRRMGKRERSDYYSFFVCGHVLVTVREALATAPGITSVRIAALRAGGKTAYGSSRLVCLLAAGFRRNDLERVSWSTADSAQIVNEVSFNRVINQDGRSKELQPVDLSLEPDLAALVGAVEQGDSDQPVAPLPAPTPSAQATDNCPSLDHVRIAQQAVWTSRGQLANLRRSSLPHEQVRDAMQTSVQTALDTTSNVFGRVGDEVVSAVKAGGSRGQAGEAALVHVKNSMRALEHVTAHARGRDPERFLDDVEAVVRPLESAAREMLRA